MDIRPIKTDADLEWALAEVERYFDIPPAPGTDDAKRFDVLSDLIENYENKHHPVDAPDPVAVLQFYMEQNGYTQVDLAKVIGSTPRASEVLSHKRRLNLNMIREIRRQWKISADSLIGPDHLEA